MSLPIPLEGSTPQLGVHVYVKDIRPLTDAAFSALNNRTASGKGKVWRRSVWIDRGDLWDVLAQVQKVPSWRGEWKVSYYKPDHSVVEAWFKTEADAEHFLLNTWSLFV